MARRGEYDAKYIPITSDVCGIVDRLRELDNGYFVMLNRFSGKYEVHHEEQLDDTLACELPFSQLDDRTIQHVRETSIERSKQLFEELMKSDEVLMQL